MDGHRAMSMLQDVMRENDELRAECERQQAGFAEACQNFRILRARYDALKESYSELLWSNEAARPLPSTDARLVESETHVGEYLLGEVLGRGRFATVLAATTVDGRKVAVKRVEKRAVRTLVALEFLSSELEAMLELSGGPSMLFFERVMVSQQHVYFVLERCGVELYSHMRSQGGKPLSREFVEALACGVADALAFMHGLHIAHRDVKPENVLVELCEDGGGCQRVKLCDMGLAQRMRVLGTQPVVSDARYKGAAPRLSLRTILVASDASHDESGRGLGSSKSSRLLLEGCSEASNNTSSAHREAAAEEEEEEEEEEDSQHHQKTGAYGERRNSTPRHHAVSSGSQRGQQLFGSGSASLDSSRTDSRLEPWASVQRETSGRGACSVLPEFEPLSQFCGSAGFFAPEMVGATAEGAGYDGARADVWSFGALVLEIVTLDTPFFAEHWSRPYKALSECRDRADAHAAFFSALEPVVNSVRDAASREPRQHRSPQGAARKTLKPEHVVDLQPRLLGPLANANDACAASQSLNGDKQRLPKLLDNVGALLEASLRLEPTDRLSTSELKQLLDAAHPYNHYPKAGQSSSSQTHAAAHAGARVSRAAQQQQQQQRQSQQSHAKPYTFVSHEAPPSIPSNRNLNNVEPLGQFPALSLSHSASNLLLAATPAVFPATRPQQQQPSLDDSQQGGANCVNPSPPRPARVKAPAGAVATAIGAAVRRRFKRADEAARRVATMTRGGNAADGGGGGGDVLYNDNDNDDEDPSADALPAETSAEGSSSSSSSSSSSDTSLSKKGPQQQQPGTGSPKQQRQSQQPAPQQQHQPRFAPRGPPAPLAVGATARLLIVDDSPTVLRLTRSKLERYYDCEIHTALSAHEALRLMSQRAYTALLTDVMMPSMDGFQLVAAIRAMESDQNAANLRNGHPPHRIVVCIITNMPTEVLISGDAPPDVDQILAKPLDVSALSYPLPKKPLALVPRRIRSGAEQPRPTTNDKGPPSSQGHHPIARALDVCQ